MPAPVPGRSGRCHGLRPDAAGQQLHGCPLPQNGLAVFDPQNVVGRLQQIRSTGAQCFGGCGTGGGKGQAAFQLAAQRRRERRTAQRGSRCLQGGGLRGFGTERKGIAPQRGQQMYPGSGKLFCAGVGIGRRQRHHQVRPGSQRCAHPHSFRQDGYPTALHNAGAHAHRDGTGPRCRSMRSCNAWPLWNGSYSAMMPTKFISSTPDSLQILFAYAEKSLAMFSASLYNKFV